MTNKTPITVGMIALVGGLSLFTQMSTFIFLPSIPSISASLGASGEAAKFAVTSFLLAQACGQLIFGPVSDRFGRRPVLGIGLVVFLASTILCALAPNIETLIAGRFMQGLGACAGQVVSRAIVRDLYERDDAARVASYIGVALTLAPSLGPLVGGTLDNLYGWRAGFVLLTVAGATAAVAVALALKETLRFPDPTAINPLPMLRNYRTLITSPIMQRYIICGAALISAQFVYLTGVPFVLAGPLGLTPDLVGYFFTLPTIGILLGSLLSARMAGVWRGDTLILIGLTGSALAGVAAAALIWIGYLNIYVLMVPIIAMPLTAGVIYPHMMAGALQPFPAMAGAASALFGFTQALASALGALLSGLFTGDSPAPLIAAMATIFIVAIALSGARGLRLR